MILRSSCNGTAMSTILALLVCITQLQGAQAGCPNASYSHINIAYNMTLLQAKADPLQCTAAGQNISYPSSCTTSDCVNHTCTASDVINVARFNECAAQAFTDAATFFRNRLCIVKNAVGSDPDHVCTITAEPIFRNLTLVAVQSTTEFGGNYSRGTRSTINFVPSIITAALTGTNDQCYRTMYRYALHFTVHVLGFDRTQLTNWRHPSDPTQEYEKFDNVMYPYGPVAPWNDQSKSIMLDPSTQDLFNSSLVNGTRRVMLVTPNALAAARAHFGCPTMTGIQLEELGAAEMHWERRVVNYELMSTEFNMAPDSPLSSITLAALVDTGWYVLDGSAAEDYAWGRGWGCAFVLDECGSDTWKYFFCNASFGMAYDRSYVAPCATTVLSAQYQVDGVYQHFENPAEGGWDPYADYCPYAGNLSVLDRCNRAPADNSVGQNFTNTTGTRSLAVHSSLLNQSLTLRERSPFVLEPRCIQFLCLNASFMMYRAGDAFYACQGAYPALSELTFQPVVGSATRPFSSSAVPAYDFYGQVQCPNITEECGSGSPLYVANLDGTSYPQLVSIEPRNASVAGGVSLTVTWSYGIDLNAECKALLIGGQLTNSSSYEIGGKWTTESLKYTQTFTINTTAVLSTGPYGGPNDDGSGTVDVSLMCTVGNSIVCGPTYSGLCSVATWQQGFEYLPLPEGAADLGFLGSTIGQAVVALVGILGLFLLLVLASVIAGKFSDEEEGQEGHDEHAPKLQEKLLEGQAEEVELVSIQSTPAEPLLVMHEHGNATVVAQRTQEQQALVPSAAQYTAPQLPPAAPQPAPPAAPARTPSPPEPPVFELSDDDEPPPPPPPPPRPGSAAAAPPPPPPPAPKAKASKASKGPAPPAPPPPDDDESPPPPPHEDGEVSL